jgi:hypothetical protein
MTYASSIGSWCLDLSQPRTCVAIVVVVIIVIAYSGHSMTLSEVARLVEAWITLAAAVRAALE